MTSRERVTSALNHRQPDRAPVSLGSNIVDGFTKYAKDRFEAYLGLEVTPHELTHKPMGTVVTPKALMDRYGMDFRTVRLKAPWNNPSIEFADGSYLDDFGVVMKPSQYYYDPVKRPLAGPITLDDILRCSLPEPYAPGRVEGLREEAEKLRHQTDFALVADIMCGGPFEQAIWLRGFEDFLCDLYIDPGLAEALMERITETDIGLWDVFLSAVGDLVDVVCQGDDLAMQDRAFIPLDIYNKHIKKYHKRIYDFIRSKTKAKIFHHSCGSVYELIPDLIDAGVDILNPIQTSAANMEPERLKREFGKDLAFWGGIDTQRILPFGTPKQIADEVRRVIEAMSGSGGYVFAPGHNIQALVPPENIAAMLDAAVNYR